MTDNPTLNRRRVLELSGIGTGIAVAGCMNQVDGDGGDGESRRVTVSLQIDQEEIQQRQAELQEEAQSGNASQEELQEGQEEIQELQEEALSEALDSAESEFEDAGISIEDQLEGQGALLISGSDSDILDVLETDVVQAMYGESAFEQAKQAQEQQQQQQTVESNESTGE